MFYRYDTKSYWNCCWLNHRLMGHRWMGHTLLTDPLTHCQLWVERQCVPEASGRRNSVAGTTTSVVDEERSLWRGIISCQTHKSCSHQISKQETVYAMYTMTRNLNSRVLGQRSCSAQRLALPSRMTTVKQLLTLLLTLCGLTSQKTHRRGLGLSGSVDEEAHPCFPYSS